MRTDQLLLTFPAFIALFFTALAKRFEVALGIFGPDRLGQGAVYFQLFLAILFLHLSLRVVLKVGQWVILLVSLGTTGFLYVAITHYEDREVHAAWLRTSDPEHFITVKGHCAPMSGRAMLRFLNRMTESGARFKVIESRVDAECRLKHLQYLEMMGMPICNNAESATQCHLKWLESLGRSGVWDPTTRLWLFEKALQSWKKDQDHEAIVNYVLKDQEISLLSAQDAEKARHVEVSWQIFAEVAKVLPDHGTAGKPEPSLLKFREAYSEFLSRGAN